MSAAGWMLVAAPVVALVVLSALLRPRAAGAVAPYRLGVVRAALLTGVFAVLTVELLGAVDALTLPAFALAWLLFVAGVAVVAGRRRGRDALRPRTAAAETRRAVLVGATVGGPTAESPTGSGPTTDGPTARRRRPDRGRCRRQRGGTRTAAAGHRPGRPRGAAVQR